MSYENVRTEMDGELLIVTLHRPEKRNAMTHQMRVDLLDCARRAEADDAVKAIVFTGHGEESFCAGANIPELEQRTLVTEMGPSATLRKELPTAIERLGKPSIAAINGYCFGAGLEFAMGCTIRIASENALLGLPEINFGQIPGSGGTQRLYRFVGLGWAMQMILTGQRVEAGTAREIGLVTEVLPPAELMLSRQGAGAPARSASPDGLRRRARRRPALHGNGASGGHRLRAQALRHLHGDRGQPRGPESLRRKARAPVQGPLIPGSRMKPSLLEPGKNRGLSRRRLLDARDDGGALRRLMRGIFRTRSPAVIRRRRSPGGNWTNAPDRIAANLIARGIERDARALVQMPSSNREIVLRIALKKAGIIGCYAPMQWRSKELGYAHAKNSRLASSSPRPNRVPRRAGRLAG